MFIEGRAAFHAVCIALGATLVACSLVLGLKDGVIPDGGPLGDGGPPGDERAVLTPDASTAICGDAGVDGSFARTLQADPDSVFVLLGGSTIVASCGTKVDPCGTIATGIAVANANRAKAIYIGPGTYPETLDIPSGVSVEGGFDVKGSVWTPLCENITTTIAPASATVVQADNVLNAAIRFLTIETKAHGDPGESVFAVRATGSQVLLENVNLYAELAGPGQAGSAGSGTANDPSCADAGTTGAPGSAGAGGSFGTSGYQVGALGGVGASGVRGAGGAYSAASCSNTCVDQCTTMDLPTDDAGVAIDDAGNEIPDGATTACTNTTKNVCGSDTTTTCGGAGGLGGAGGGGGAASVAVFASGATTNVTITGGALVSAGGGLGGAGGPGAAGGKGDDARSGSSALCYTTCDVSCTQGATQTMLLGASSTSGGTGGAGGLGGGGAGGPSFLVVTIDGAIVTSSQKNQWQIPTVAAPGGQPNGAPGAFGESSP